MTHRELDDLFRANSERGDFTPQPEEWEAMTQLLEADERRRRLGKVVSLAWMALFATLIGWGTYGAYRVISSPSDSAPTTTQLSTPLHEATPFAAGSPSLSTTTLTGSDATSNPLSSAPAGAASTGVASSATATVLPGSATVVGLSPKHVSRPSVETEKSGHFSDARPAAVKTQVTPTPTRTATGSQVQASASSATVEVQQALRTAGTKVPVASEKRKSEPSFASQNTLAQPPPELAATALRVQRLHPRSLELIASGKVPATLSVPQIQPSAGPLTVARPKAQRPRFSFGTLAAGEVTSVGMQQELRWGARGGVVAHASILPHWEVQTGLTYGRKRYHAAPDHYHMVDGFWVGGVEATDTESKTDILEVPLLLTYHLRDQSQYSSLFVSAGLTSYFLRKEEFSYAYPHEVPGQNHGHSMYNQHRTVMGVLQFQLGYRLRATDKLAYRISPFVSVPLDGVGYGEVQLYTGGVSFELELH